MLTILEYAELSKHVYTPEHNLLGKRHVDVDRHYIESVLPTLRSSTIWFRVIDVDPRMQTHNAFYAQLYIKIDRQVSRYFDEVNLKSEENCAPDEIGSAATPNRLAYDLVSAAML